MASCCALACAAMKILILTALAALALTVSAIAQTDVGSLIVNHQIETGMTFADVVAALGNPQKTLTVPVSPGARGASDAWWYPQTVVLFKDGRVSCVHRCDSDNGQ